MITIIVDTKEEYDEMMEWAHSHMCRRLSFAVCGRYAQGMCKQCYKDNHIKCGIRVIPLDSETRETL